METEQEAKAARESKEMNDYLEQMDELERTAFEIARSHLGTSFHIPRSNGLKEWRQFQVDIKKYLADLEPLVRSPIEERKAREGNAFVIHKTLEFKDWMSLQDEINKFLSSVEKESKKACEELKEKKKAEGYLFRIEELPEFLLWREKEKQKKKK
jgi:hypothetical protein